MGRAAAALPTPYLTLRGVGSDPCPKAHCICVLYQDKLYQPEYQEVSTEEQREEISGKLSAASNWLEDEGFGATTVVRGPLGCGRQMGRAGLPF